MKKRILVLTDHLPWGHRSIAKAIYGYLTSGLDGEKYEIKYAEVKSEMGIAEDFYLLIYKFIPSAQIFTHKLGSTKIFRDTMRELSSANLIKVKKVVEDYKPDLVISSFFLHSISLAKWRQKSKAKFKLWTVAADPRTINLGSFVPDADLNLVYDESIIAYGLKAGVDRNKMIQTGWWVREEMYGNLKQKNELKKKLGFSDDRPIVFVSAGSMGSRAITKVLPALMVTKKKVGVIFNTGADKLLLNTITEFSKLLRRIRKDDIVQVKVLGWVENMKEVLDISDLVMGKAGPNFLFDVVACEKPLVAITHISGQEDGNIELIREKKLGWIREKNGSAGKFLLKYLDNPDEYNKKFAQTIKEEADRNRKTKDVIINMVKEI